MPFDGSFNDDFDIGEFMTNGRIIDVFKGLGKLIRLGAIGLADASGVKAHMVATLQQFGRQDGDSEQYDDYLKVVVPLETRVQPTIAAMERIPALAKASAD